MQTLHLYTLCTTPQLEIRKIIDADVEVHIISLRHCLSDCDKTSAILTFDGTKLYSGYFQLSYRLHIRSNAFKALSDNINIDCFLLEICDYSFISHPLTFIRFI